MQMFLKEKQQHLVSLTYDNFKEDAPRAGIQNIGDLCPLQFKDSLITIGQGRALVNRAVKLVPAVLFGDS